jgi:hypothetical protein
MAYGGHGCSDIGGLQRRREGLVNRGICQFVRGVVDGERPHKGGFQGDPVYRDVTLPAGTTLRLDLASSVSSDASKVEDPVSARVREAVVIDGQTVVPTGASLSGVVTEADDSGRVKGRARESRINSTR